VTADATAPPSQSPSPSAFDRRIQLEGAVNFRDLGGYAAAAGAHTRWRTLFRADGLGDLTETDFSTMRALGIRTVIDLRSAEELERGRYDVGAHPVTFHHFPIIEKPPDVDEIVKRPGLLRTQYLDMIRDAGPSFVSVLEILATPGALPAVVHCTAGKDRTGVLSAIVLSLLGVDEPTVVADYALSGEAMPSLRAKIIVKYPDSRETIENLSGAFSAEPAKMEALLDHLRATYGSVDAYVAGLGAGPELGARLRAALLEPAG
jgi:protein-tyrosine phosphatase